MILENAVSADRCVAAIGFNVETVQYKNIRFQVWDLGMAALVSPTRIRV